jgi:hypothetical protein
MQPTYFSIPKLHAKLAVTAVRILNLACSNIHEGHNFVSGFLDFWGVTPFNQTKFCQSFGGTHCPHFQGSSTQQRGALSSNETSASFH